MYEERFYRRITRPSDLHCYEVRHKETDLWCCTTRDLREVIADRVLHYRHRLEEYIKARPLFAGSLLPVDEDPFAPAMAQEMIRASALVGVGPMATVAGAFAEFVGRDIEAQSDEFIIENGGDIYLRTRRERISMVYAGNSLFGGKVGIRLKPSSGAYGVCTSSGTVGPSLSLGGADAVCVVADSAILADGLATYLGNSVNKKGDIPPAIEKGRRFPGVRGILVIVGEGLGAWGDIEIVKT